MLSLFRVQPHAMHRGPANLDSPEPTSSVAAFSSFSVLPHYFSLFPIIFHRGGSAPHTRPGGWAAASGRTEPSFFPVTALLRARGRGDCPPLRAPWKQYVPYAPPYAPPYAHAPSSTAREVDTRLPYFLTMTNAVSRGCALSRKCLSLLSLCLFMVVVLPVPSWRVCVGRWTNPANALDETACLAVLGSRGPLARRVISRRPLCI